jgi:uncharacterized protein
MSNIDQQFIEFVVKSLVGKPEAVQVDRRVDEKGVLLELTVDPEDLGRVIGKRGATAQSLRTLLRALGTKNDARYNLKIIDNGVGAPGAAHDSTTDSATPADGNGQPAMAADDTATTTPAAASDDSSSDVAVDEDEPVVPTGSEPSDRLAQTRKELADLDDLDV